MFSWDFYVPHFWNIYDKIIGTIPDELLNSSRTFYYYSLIFITQRKENTCNNLENGQTTWIVNRPTYISSIKIFTTHWTDETYHTRILLFFYFLHIKRNGFSLIDEILLQLFYTKGYSQQQYRSHPSVAITGLASLNIFLKFNEK